MDTGCYGTHCWSRTEARQARKDKVSGTALLAFAGVLQVLGLCFVIRSLDLKFKYT